MVIKHNRIYPFIFLIVIFLLVASCNGGGTPVPPTNSSSPQVSALPSEPIGTFTPRPPTATPVPMAAMINGEGVPLAEYQAQMIQYQSALQETGSTPPAATDQSKTVMDNLIAETLLGQAAAKAGFSVSTEDVQSRIDQLASSTGGGNGLADWEKKNGYTDQSFRQALARSIAAAWQRDQIVSQVPDTADQVHARQILVNTQAEAQSILNQLNAGADFATLANYYNTDTGGDLGWFPRGYLTIPEVESAAFSLKPGEYSDIIHSKVGFHIIQVIERDANHPLSADARLILQNQALQKWIDDRKAQSQITVLVP